MINNSHFIVEFPEKTHSTQYIKREIIDEQVDRWGLPIEPPTVKLLYSSAGMEVTNWVRGPAAMNTIHKAEAGWQRHPCVWH